MLNLEYLHADGVADYLERQKGHVLGVVAFGAGTGTPAHALQPAPLHVSIPLLTGPQLKGRDASFEVWSSSSPVAACGAGNINASTDGDVLFGSLAVEQPDGASLQTLSRQAYLEIFEFADRMGCRHLLRAWNYLPRINEAEQGLERYRCFNVGRHEAFAQAGRSISEENVPAASVLGCSSGPMAIYFIASRRAGKPVDNPRQLTAYKYPEQYGPRSPIFVRAMQTNFGEQQCLFVSGTASIIGHETVHAGSAGQQTQETLRNIRTLLSQAYPSGTADGGTGRMLLKAYVRHAQDMEQVRAHVEQEFGAVQQTVYLLSDICRTDLLLEIEGVYFSGVQA